MTTTEWVILYAAIGLTVFVIDVRLHGNLDVGDLVCLIFYIPVWPLVLIVWGLNHWCGDWNRVLWRSKK